MGSDVGSGWFLSSPSLALLCALCTPVQSDVCGAGPMCVRPMLCDARLRRAGVKPA